MIGENKALNEIHFSVIIPAYNAERTLSFCLEALHAQSLPKKDYEVYHYQHLKHENAHLSSLSFRC